MSDLFNELLFRKMFHEEEIIEHRILSFLLKLSALDSDIVEYKDQFKVRNWIGNMSIIPISIPILKSYVYFNVNNIEIPESMKNDVDSGKKGFAIDGNTVLNIPMNRVVKKDVKWEIFGTNLDLITDSEVLVLMYLLEF